MKIQVIVHFISFFLQIGANNVLSQPPHIIIIFVDDLGWNDVSFHGSLQIPTSNIDALAYNGIILNNYYVQPICTPSRGSLMTGKYPIRLGLQHNVIYAAEPWGLSPKEVLLPQHFKNLGYATHGIGKWHLGYFRKDYLPTNRGFDSFFGYYNGNEDYFTHFAESEAECGLDFHDNEENAWNYTGFYGTEAFTDRAKRIIRSHDQSKPLFLYFAHQAVHAPLQAPREYIKRFSHIKDNSRRVFAAMTSALDMSIGEIFFALDEENMLQNTIIVFSTDNGAAVKGIDGSTGSNWPLRGSKYNMWEGGVRGTAFIWGPLLHTFRGTVSRHLMHISDWLPTLYAAAGEDPKQLGTIDGYNLWPSLTQNVSSPRDHILHNIDPAWKVESIRKGQYKLLKGSVFGGKFDGWFDKEGNKQTSSEFNKEGKKQTSSEFDKENLFRQREIYLKLLKDSNVYQILTKKNASNVFPDFKLTTDDGHIENCGSLNGELKRTENVYGHNTQDQFAHAVKVDCGVKPENASTDCQPMEGYCLFDIENDPCEFHNLLNSLPSVVQQLKESLDKYRSQSVPIRNKPFDPKSNPKYHGYAWIPWIETV